MELEKLRLESPGENGVDDASRESSLTAVSLRWDVWTLERRVLDLFSVLLWALNDFLFFLQLVRILIPNNGESQSALRST